MIRLGIRFSTQEMWGDASIQPWITYTYIGDYFSSSFSTQGLCPCSSLFLEYSCPRRLRRHQLKCHLLPEVLSDYLVQSSHQSFYYFPLSEYFALHLTQWDISCLFHRECSVCPLWEVHFSLLVTLCPQYLEECQVPNEYTVNIHDMNINEYICPRIFL